MEISSGCIFNTKWWLSIFMACVLISAFTWEITAYYSSC